jgi:hypothetical protein
MPWKRRSQSLGSAKDVVTDAGHHQKQLAASGETALRCNELRW